MSKRLCISLLHAPRRTHQSLPQCALQTTHHNHHRPRRHNAHPIPSQRRTFTSTPPTYGMMQNPNRQVNMKRPAQASIAVEQKKQMEAAQHSGQALERLGLLPTTFVPPTKPPLLPSWTTATRSRLKLEYLKIRHYVLETYYHLYQTRWLKIPNADKKDTPQIAFDIYTKMYKKFAAGDLSGLEGQVNPGMLSSLRSRIAHRPHSTVALDWTLHKTLSPPQLISYTFSPFTTTPLTAIAQSIIKFRTRQSLLKIESRRIKTNNRTSTVNVHVDHQGNIIAPEILEEYRIRSAKDLTEYVVLQKFWLNGKEGKWHLWGTTEEMGLEAIEERKRKTEQLAMQRGKMVNGGQRGLI